MISSRDISIVLLALMLAAVSGCAHRPGKTLVLRYEDFGPQAAAYPLIGYQWYQWNNHGDSDPKKEDVIKVVVYEGVSVKELRERFPVDQAILQDYRYVPKRKAVKYLDISINVLSVMGTFLPEMQEQMVATRRRIVDHFGATQ